MNNFSHLDEHGNARMVDVGEKPETARTAVASGRVTMKPETLQAIHSESLEKGNVLQVARLAGIMATKQTASLIPLCHPLGIDAVDLQFQMDEPQSALNIRATVSVFGKTGVEMEAMTAVSVAALTVYDMCKSIDKEMSIEQIQLDKKTGGKSGPFERAAPQNAKG